MRHPAGLLVLAAMGFAWGFAWADDLPPDVILLAHFKQKVRQDIARLANCTCLETMERSVRPPGADTFQFLDRVRLEVTHAGEKELLAWPGGAHFEEKNVSSFVAGGLTVSGMFASQPRNVFVNDQGTFKYRGAEDLDGRQTVRFDFHIPLLASAYNVRIGGQSARVASRGSFWFDAKSLSLIRLEVRAEEIPERLGLAGSLIKIEYAPAQEAIGEVLLPQSAEIMLTHSDGEVRRNTVRFANCRTYTAESSITFGAEAPTAGASQTSKTQVDLPAGLTIHTELETGLDWTTAAIGDPVRARVTDDVRKGGTVILPKGAMVSGRVQSMERASKGGFVIGMELTEAEWGDHRAEFRARLLEVQMTAPVKPGRGAMNDSANITGLAGGSIQSDITVDQSSVRKADAPKVPGLCALWLKEEQWRVAAGLRMVWRTIAS